MWAAVTCLSILAMSISAPQKHRERPCWVWVGSLQRSAHYYVSASVSRLTFSRRRGRKQDRARVAGGQDYEVRYAAKKAKRSAGAVKKAVRKVGSSPSVSSIGSDVERRPTSHFPVGSLGGLTSSDRTVSFPRR